ncbi:MAG: fibronectin type III domain-containing protein, partial [Candidatus Lambdaproteobacteria bacterium]|nr:fibronectin type III domain-containing protein [Candidatus Lambdaproteobacteria bacterium]
DATGYALYWAAGAGVTTASTRVAGATSPYTHTGLTNGQPYCYRVRGVNGVGEGPLSNEACATPQVAAPGAQPSPQSGARRILAAGEDHTLAIQSNGTIWA